MKQQAVIFHGTGSSPNDFWIPWLTNDLRARGFDVVVPQLPKADTPDLSVWTPFVQENVTIEKDAILIGHSAGCPLVLSMLHKIEVPIKRAILVAGYTKPVPNMPEDHPMIMKQIDWARLKRMCAEFVFIHSDNDPWGCDVAQGEIMRQNLGGTMAVLSGHGHFGSNIFKQPYQIFPLLRDFCLTETLTPPALLA